MDCLTRSVSSLHNIITRYFRSMFVLLLLCVQCVMQTVTAWSGRLLTSYGHPIKRKFSRDRSIAYISTGITEKIRHESQVEMGKISDLFSLRQSQTRLIKTSKEFTSYLKANNIQNFLFDCDGVLYRGTDSMPGATQTIQTLLDNEKRVFFVTNNAASSRKELKDKLETVLRLPEGTLEEEMMVGSAYVAAEYLRLHLMKKAEPHQKKVHVIGTAGLCKEMQSAGFYVSGGPDPTDTPSGMSRDELAAYAFPEGEVDAVVIGLDNDFNYRKLCVTTVLLQRNPQALLIATNRDAFDLVGYDSRHLP